MTNPHLDLVALCIWREARGEGVQGMTAVASVIKNRAAKHKMTPAQAVMVPWAFSSMTAHGDPQLGNLPHDGDSTWAESEQLSSLLGTLVDTTDGATLYYDDSIPFPHSWNPAHVQATVKVGRLNFFREV